MRTITSLLIVLLLSTSAYCLDVDDVISLANANVGDDIIVSVIAVSDEPIVLSTNDIIKLKKAGVSDKVIKTLVDRAKRITKNKQRPQKKTAKKVVKKQREEVAIQERRDDRREQTRENEREDERELKPFDQFFLSTYYSHQYGFPEKDYNSPSDILNRGLYYNSGYKNYPNARRVRVYGQGFSGNRFGFNASPYSIIVPRRNRHFKNYRYRGSRGSNYYRRHFNNRGCYKR
ncbi:hypothetical protein [Candidatus Uabimicrobium sp. HlEnr_7]|uniref:hypothetical protein n=1 Tax=Candidatus Uabimicrobium helgolandensis TaxID=3095367 RepID=UPI0035582C34